MANMCTYGGCKRAATTGHRCDKHVYIRPERKEYEHEKNGGLNNIYNSTKWKRLRAIKRKQNPLCELCEIEDKLTPSEHVDHWLEVSDFGKHGMIWDINNLVCLCQTCHNQKTAQYRQFKKANKQKLYWFLTEFKPTPISDSHKALAREVLLTCTRNSR